MQLEKINTKLKCDVPGCKQKAEFIFKFGKVLGIGNTYVCKSCLQEVFEHTSKMLVPKSIKNVYKKNNEIVEGE